MDHSAGLDVSVKETSVCIVDETGRIVLFELSGSAAMPTPATQAPHSPCWRGP